VHVAGVDPVQFLEAQRERIGYIHLKDYARQPDTNDRAGLIWRELGNGVMDWQAVLPVLPTLDVEWALVEQDRTDREPGESLQISRHYLKEQFNYWVVSEKPDFPDIA
jgi:sugar phosphate isomerase/epimerase